MVSNYVPGHREVVYPTVHVVRYEYVPTYRALYVVGYSHYSEAKVGYRVFYVVGCTVNLMLDTEYSSW